MITNDPIYTYNYLRMRLHVGNNNRTESLLLVLSITPKLKNESQKSFRCQSNRQHQYGGALISFKASQIVGPTVRWLLCDSSEEKLVYLDLMISGALVSYELGVGSWI